MAWQLQIGKENILDVDETIGLLDRLVYTPLFNDCYKYFGEKLMPAVPMIISPPGWGKTSIIKDLGRRTAEKLKKRFEPIVIEVAIYSVGDLLGYGRLMPSVEAPEYTQFFPPEPFNRLFEKGEQYILVFLDELNRAKRDVLNQLLRLALERVFAGRKLRERAAIISAINPVAVGAQVQEIPEALLERFFPVFGLTPEAEEVYRYFTTLFETYEGYGEEESIEDRAIKAFKFGYGLIKDFLAYCILVKEGILAKKKTIRVKLNGKEEVIGREICVKKTEGVLLDIGFEPEIAKKIAERRFAVEHQEQSIGGTSYYQIYSRILNLMREARPEEMREAKYKKHISPRNLEFTGRAIALWCFSSGIEDFINAVIKSWEAELTAKTTAMGVMLRGSLGSTEVIPGRPVGTQFFDWLYYQFKEVGELKFILGLPTRKKRKMNIGV